MKIVRYRWLISYGTIQEEEFDVEEKEKSYIGTYNYGGVCRFLKSSDDKAKIKDRTTYPYIDFFSTKDSSKEYAIGKIIDFLVNHWGLDY